MASYLENLTTRREAIATELAALNATKAGGLPDSQASGVAHRAYKDGLYAELEKLDKLIQSAQADEDGPVDLETRGEAIW